MNKLKYLSFGLIMILGLLSFSSIKKINSGYQVGDEATDFKLQKGGGSGWHDRSGF